MKNTNIKYLPKFLIYILIIAALFVHYSYAIENQILRKPWLQGIESDKVIVMVETKSVKVEEILYKEKSSTSWREVKSGFSYPTENNKSHVHRFTLNNLKQGTDYIYKVGGLEYHYSHPDFSECIKIANMGDNRSGPKKWEKISKLMNNRNPDFSIFNGDLAYKNDYNYWNDEFFTENASNFISEIPFYNATGNHEGWKINTKAFTQSTAGNEKNLPFYSVEYPNLKILILNTEINVQPNSKQWKYAEDFLSKNQDKWTIVSFHIPAYSSGGHGENKNMIRMTNQIFEKYRVDLITNGHSHFYQRNIVNGITHLVVGSSGSPLYSPEKASYTVQQKKAYHYAIFNICKSTFEVKVFDINDELIDEFEL